SLRVRDGCAALSLSPLFLSSLAVFFTDPATPEIYPLSLHDALPISCSASRCCCWRRCCGSCGRARRCRRRRRRCSPGCRGRCARSEEHTSELQSLTNLVCRLLLEKKKNNIKLTSPDQL